MISSVVANPQHTYCAIVTQTYVLPQEVASLMNRDSLSGYDVDITEEGDVIRDFLARIEGAAVSRV
jgi:hypothetical protein